MLTELANEMGVSKNQAAARAVREAWSRRQSRSFTHSTLNAISADREVLLNRLAK